ncbi:hypothetical protein IT575_08935 [bacterium]|nr:hypothetical protein [bacterium]
MPVISVINRTVQIIALAAVGIQLSIASVSIAARAQNFEEVLLPAESKIFPIQDDAVISYMERNQVGAFMPVPRFQSSKSWMSLTTTRTGMGISYAVAIPGAHDLAERLILIEGPPMAEDWSGSVFTSQSAQFEPDEYDLFTENELGIWGFNSDSNTLSLLRDQVLSIPLTFSTDGTVVALRSSDSGFCFTMRDGSCRNQTNCFLLDSSFLRGHGNDLPPSLELVDTIRRPTAGWTAPRLFQHLDTIQASMYTSLDNGGLVIDVYELRLDELDGFVLHGSYTVSAELLKRYDRPALDSSLLASLPLVFGRLNKGATLCSTVQITYVNGNELKIAGLDAILAPLLTEGWTKVCEPEFLLDQDTLIVVHLLYRKSSTGQGECALALLRPSLKAMLIE